jgi:type III secretory pathway component EscT
MFASEQSSPSCKGSHAPRNVVLETWRMTCRFMGMAGRRLVTLTQIGPMKPSSSNAIATHATLQSCVMYRGFAQVVNWLDGCFLHVVDFWFLTLLNTDVFGSLPGRYRGIYSHIRSADIQLLRSN